MPLDSLDGDPSPPSNKNVGATPLTPFITQGYIQVLGGDRDANATDAMFFIWKVLSEESKATSSSFFKASLVSTDRHDFPHSALKLPPRQV